MKVILFDIDKEKNTDSCSVPVKDEDITAADSKVKLLVIPTNEELVISRPRTW